MSLSPFPRTWFVLTRSQQGDGNTQEPRPFLWVLSCHADEEQGNTPGLSSCRSLLATWTLDVNGCPSLHQHPPMCHRRCLKSGTKSILKLVCSISDSTSSDSGAKLPIPLLTNLWDCKPWNYISIFFEVPFDFLWTDSSFLVPKCIIFLWKLES